MNIHYIAQWGENTLGRKLSFSPAGLTKMKYVLSVLKTLNANIYVASFSNVKTNVRKFYLSKNSTTDDGTPIWYCATFGFDNKYIRLIDRILNRIYFITYLLFKTKKNDIIVIYHELGYLPALKFSNKFFKRNIILQVEELYTVAANYSEERINGEIQGLRKTANGYILINDTIASVCNFEASKPKVVLYGTYSCNKDTVEKFNDGKIHILYAGTLDKSKGGAWRVINAAKYLTDKYFVHLLGFGSEQEMSEIDNLATYINTNYPVEIKYEGVLLGDEYVNYLSKMHIGISAQDSNGLYNTTSFPSKVLSYMANGVTPLTVKIDVLTKSKINDYLSYYEGNEPSVLAKEITNIILKEPETLKNKIQELDGEFRSNILKMIKLLLIK